MFVQGRGSKAQGSVVCLPRGGGCTSGATQPGRTLAANDGGDGQAYKAALAELGAPVGWCLFL